MVKMTKALIRRSNLKNALIDAAEKMISREGLAGIRARSLAFEVGCAVGAIYNVVSDIDDLIFAVNERTLLALERDLNAAMARASDLSGAALAIEKLSWMARAYLDFAIDNGMRWRAMFDHRLAEGRAIPDRYRAGQRRLFGYIEEPLRELVPQATPERWAILARSLFSAVHGMISLGLDEKLGAVALADLREQVAFMTASLARGMVSGG
ncbi:MAG TPA: WHG domain-containing protein [Xanthobacteraceae bacterium]|nr:WHG domain-containing protein [Xanthobacteraceae bacterium]